MISLAKCNLPILVCACLCACAPMRKMESVRSGAYVPGLALADEVHTPDVPVERLVSDTMMIKDAEGRDLIIMKAVRDENGDMVASDVIVPSVVVASFRNVAERLGKVDLRFDINIPADLTDSRWQLRLSPLMHIMGETVQLDMAKAAEALGVDTDFLLESDCLRGMTISGMYGGYTSCFDGLAFDKNGNTIQGSGDEVAVQIEIFDDGDDVFLFSSSTDEVAEDFHLYTQFCFQVENKQYIYHTTFVSKGVFEGIKDIATSSKQSGKVFDLSGRQVMQPQRGLYIKDGKKLIVK